MRAVRFRRSQRRRMAPRRRVNRFTGFISEPSGGFVSQRIQVRTRHTAIQKSCGKRVSAVGRMTVGPQSTFEPHRRANPFTPSDPAGYAHESIAPATKCGRSARAACRAPPTTAY
ncbi:hypothetical protein DIE03_14630 [Burkholderia sp. Bp8992]|nr:hypothetical protein DIE03_14630 [Burkholderia sp. Bp8992]